LRRKIVAFVILAIIAAVVFFYLPGNERSITSYDRHIYYPFQWLRGQWFDLIPFSIGDIIYIVVGAALLVTIIKWIVWLFRFGAHKERLASSVIKTINGALFIYLFFIFGWGANYYKPALPKSWGLVVTDSSLQKLSKD